jgi:hypothetical protein
MTGALYQCFVVVRLSLPGTHFGQIIPSRKGSQRQEISHLSAVNRDSLHPVLPHQLVATLERALDSSPRIIGHPKSTEFFEVHGDPDLLSFCQWEQRVAGMNKYFIR